MKQSTHFTTLSLNANNNYANACSCYYDSAMFFSAVIYQQWTADVSLHNVILQNTMSGELRKNFLVWGNLFLTVHMTINTEL